MAEAFRPSRDDHELLARPATDGDTATGNPTVLRLMLGARLRWLRESRGLSMQQAGHAIRASDAKISRLERGRVGSKQRDVEDLLSLYRVSDPGLRRDLLALARDASAPGWWSQYSDALPAWLETYVGLEQAASGIRGYRPTVVHDLFQTREYARAVAPLARAPLSPEEIERHVELRLARQRILTAPHAPSVWAVLYEAALCRPVGGPKVMRAQLEHLLEVSELANVTIQLLPFQNAGHVATENPFTLLRFAEHDVNDVVHLEQVRGGMYLDKVHEVDTHVMAMDQLCVAAASDVRTRQFLTRLIREM